MNAGLIASRYATALLLFAQEEGMPARVYDDAGALQEALRSPQALATCVEGLSAPMQKFLSLVIRNRRTDYLAAILNSFRAQYRQEYGITRAWLTTAVDNPGLADRLTELMKQQGFTQIDFQTEVNPALIGGFIVQVEDKRLDASIASQLKQVRKDLETEIRNNRYHG